MPIIHVYLHQQDTSIQYRQAITRGIHDAMIEVLGIPEDDYNQITHQPAPENMIYDRNFYNVPRSENAVFITLEFNQRPKEVKDRLFTAIVRNLGDDPGIDQRDLFMMIDEIAAENWWAYARQTDPQTGLDARMTT